MNVEGIIPWKDIGKNKAVNKNSSMQMKILNKSQNAFIRIILFLFLCILSTKVCIS